MYWDASDVSIDQKVLHTMDMTVFDMDTVHRDRNRFAQFYSMHIGNDDDDEFCSCTALEASLCRK